MGKIESEKPASFTKSDASDRSSVTIVNSLLNHPRLKSQITFGDKFPNTDGSIILTTADGVYFGEIQVQIKTLKKGSSKSKIKHSTSLKFLSYCNTQISIPVLLIVVDQSAKTAYWIHINKNILKQLNERSKSKTVTVEFPVQNKITDGDFAFIDEWQQIIEDSQNIIRNAEEINTSYLELKNRFYSITNNAENIVEETNDYVTTKFQEFLTSLNHIWGYEFDIFKNILYPNVWQFGVGYSQYAADHLTVSILPIFFGKPIIPVLKYNHDTFLWERSLNNITGMTGKNPIENNVEGFAYEIVKKDVLDALKKQIPLVNNKAIAREFIFSFINEFHYLMELKLEQQYNIDALIFAIEDTLHKNAQKIINKKPGLLISGYFNLDLVRMRLTKEEIDHCIQELAIPVVATRINSENYNILTVRRLLRFLKNSGQLTIEALYTPRQLKVSEKGYYFLEEFTEKQKKERVKISYENFAVTYKEFIKNLFPNIKSKLRYKFDLTVVLLEKETTEWVDYYGFKSDTRSSEKSVKIIIGSSKKYSRKNLDALRAGTIIDGQKYFLESGGSFAVRQLHFKDPLKNLISEAILKQITSYFDQRVH